MKLRRPTGRAVSGGATIHYPPEEDRDEPGYHAFFVFDPDGFRIEVFCWSPLGSGEGVMETTWNDGHRFSGRVALLTGAGGTLGGAVARVRTRGGLGAGRLPQLAE